MDKLGRYEHFPDPVTMAIVLAPVALEMMGQITEGMAAKEEGEAEAEIAEYNARVSEQRAEEAERKAAYEAKKHEPLKYKKAEDESLW